MPDEGVSADDHVVSLCERDQRVGAAKVVGLRICVRPRMDESELHRVFGLQLTELRAEDVGVICFREKRWGGSCADENMMGFSSLSQCCNRRRLRGSKNYE